MTSKSVLSSTDRPRRVMLLMTPKTYRARPFVEAAERLGIETLKVVDMPEALAAFWNYEFGVPFADVDRAAQRLVEIAASRPVDAILSVDDSASLLAACASAALGLRHNSVQAAEAARDKHVMRRLLSQGGVPVPEFRLCSTGDDLHRLAQQVQYPCVVKPLKLSGSQGVIRADDPPGFVAAAGRLAALLQSIDPSPQAKPFLVERFIPGVEVALEGVIDDGRLTVLALFDKPDPLDGPFFEETLYVTPSRLPQATQAAVVQCAADAARALGLREGPMHAELRVNAAGPWLIEVAGRSIGGQCGKTLRFGTDASLEELILRQACGLEFASLRRERRAGGVMMIPIPEAGMLTGVEGVAEAEAVPGVEQVQISARLHYPLVPLPEGDSYLGFIFARGDTPDEVEAALREAHRRLRFNVEPAIMLTAAG